MPGSLLLEAGFPGLPSNIFGQKLPNIKKLVSDVIEQEKFSCSRTRFWLTNHRLGILIEAIADTQSDSIKEVRGPKVSAAYDLNNIPTPAATGFATAQGLALKDLLVKEVDGEKFLFAKRKTQGQSLAHCLPKIAEKIFKAVFAEVPGWFEKSLFPQPLLNLCAMLNDQILDLEIDQVKAGSEVINLKRFQQKNFPLDNALLYPEVMQKLGIMNEISEKKKAYEARVNAILPEGYMIRDFSSRILQASIFHENAEPLLIKFSRKYLEMPEIILIKILDDYFGYVICEDKHGKVLPAAIATPPGSENAPDEADIRSAMINQELQRVWEIWNRDVHSLPGRLEELAEKLPDHARSALFCDCSLMGIAEGLCELSGSEVDNHLVNSIIALIEEGEKTEIGRILKGTGFSVIYNRLQGVEAFAVYAEPLREICLFFEDRISSPEQLNAKIISLAILLHGHVNNIGCFDCSPERILKFLNCSSLKLDLFKCFAQLFPGFRIDRRQWIEKAFSGQSRESLPLSLIENFLSVQEFDPASFFAVYPDWKQLTNEEVEAFSLLVSRVRGRLAGVDRNMETKPSDELEEGLAELLGRLEALPGVDYQEIYEFYKNKKVDIEACLINLPPVLDDNKPELAARISLLQRLVKQLSRMPFVKKEKRNEKK